MFTFFHKLRVWFGRTFARSLPASERQTFWAENYTKLLLMQGREVAEETFANARRLGCDVEALLAEHDRRKAASWTVEFNIDLADFDGVGVDRALKLRRANLPEREIETRGRVLHVSVAGLYKRVELSDQKMTVSEAVLLGIDAIQQRLLEAPEEFPKHIYPYGSRDWKLTSFGWTEATEDWHLSGTWKAEARARSIQNVDPEHSIEPRRIPPTGKILQSAQRFPALEKITLSVWRWPDRRHVVMEVFENEAESPEPYRSPRSDSPDTLRLCFPAEDLPVLKWESNIWEYRSPATEFLHLFCLRSEGKSIDLLLPYSVEAIHHGMVRLAKPFSDLRASLVSGPDGPAPLPENIDWPSCPCCEEPALFSQSLDVRDIGFADLLPGNTMVISVCNDCLEAGEWQNCSSVVWLPKDLPIRLVERASPKPLLQLAAWYGADSKNWHDLPDHITREMEQEESVTAISAVWLSPSYGTKIGGVPAHLQQEEIFYDRKGFIMEYVAQISTPEYISTGGFGYVSHSTLTGETYIDFQDT